MKLEVIDNITDAGHPTNEDVWGKTDSAVWIIDGVTSVNAEPHFAATSDSRWLGEIATQSFARTLAGEARAPRLVEAVRAAAQDARAAMAKSEVMEYIPPSAAVTLAEIVDHELHYFSLGDVTLAVVDDHRSFVVENKLGFRREQNMLARAGRRGVGLRAAAENAEIADEIRQHRRARMNRPGGYWILGNAPEAADHGYTGYLSISPGDLLITASDGFARLVTTFHEYEDWHALTQAAQQFSLRELRDRLRELEEGDLERRKFPRMSAKDDATAVLARVVAT